MVTFELGTKAEKKQPCGEQVGRSEGRGALSTPQDGEETSVAGAGNEEAGSLCWDGRGRWGQDHRGL